MADNTVNDGDKPDTKPDTKPAPRSDGEGKTPPKAAKAEPKPDAPKRGAAASKTPPRRQSRPAPRADANDDKPAPRKPQPKRESEQANRSNDSDERGGALSSGAFWGAAAAGVGLGIALMIGRKVAVQAPTVLAGDWDKALAAEHRAVEKLFDLMQATTNKNTTKRSVLLMQLKHALAKHALQEENAVYPALRDSGMVDGADELNREHGYVKQYLYELDNCPKDSDEFLQIVQRFRADIDHHVREEEEVLYPRMKAQLDEAANGKLTTTMNKEGFKLA